jgi:hypothetical protein
VYPIDGPWTWTEEEELLKLYELKPVTRLDSAYMFDDAEGGVRILVRDEALEKIRQLRRTLYGKAEEGGSRTRHLHHQAGCTAPADRGHLG